ncbi:MAG TPA: hypothetical protein VET48_09620 [Steroidobacteraceae bacterium]|nr:hypothetical protein [Steroidobacteraceae bacterium]
MNDDNGDNWRFGAQKNIYGLIGAINSAYSNISKVFGDAAFTHKRLCARRYLTLLEPFFLADRIRWFLACSRQLDAVVPSIANIGCGPLAAARDIVGDCNMQLAR